MAHFTTSPLPISQLESLKFKANQIIDSIQGLQRTIEAGHQPAMPAWPDILSKYNLLLSQTHSFSTSLMGNPSLQAAAGGRVNPFEKIALHPNVGMTEAQLDGEVIPLLRNQQTLDVLRMENETVRRLSEHMITKGSVGVLNSEGPPKTVSGYNGMGSGKKKVEYEDVLVECDEIRSAHDRRVERAVRAVTMLRDKFEWKQRVEVEVEEPEELEWDPRLHTQQANIDNHLNGSVNGGDDEMGGDNGEDGDGDVGMESPEGGSSDENEVEGALVYSTMDSTSSPTTTTVPMPLPSGLAVAPAISSTSPDVTMAPSMPNGMGP